MVNINNNLIIKKSKTKINLNNLLAIFLSVLIFVIIVILISDYKTYNLSIKNGFMLFANCVFPGLFPFLVLTKLLTSLNIVPKLTNTLSGVTTKLFNTPGIASYVFIISALCGYPMCAKITADLTKQDVITNKEAQKILSFCCVSGPIFTIGTVGISMFGSFTVGLIIFIAHLLSALICGLIFCNINKIPKNKLSNMPATTNKINNILTDSVYGAISTIIIVGAYVTLFFMVIDMFLNTNLILPFKVVLSPLFKLFNLDPQLINGFLSGIIEITRGINDLAKTGVSAQSVVLASGLLSFSGLSIIIQSISLTISTKIKVLPFILQKITHAIICMGICTVLFKFIY